MAYPITAERLRAQYRRSSKKYQAKMRLLYPEEMREKNVITSRIWHQRHKDDPEYRLMKAYNTRVWVFRQQAARRYVRYAFARWRAEVVVGVARVVGKMGGFENP